MPPPKTSSATHLPAGGATTLSGATTTSSSATTTIRSSWIRRLLPRHSPVSANNFRHLPSLPNPSTTSDFVVRRFSNHSSRPPPPPPPPPPPVLETRPAAAFGPFQIGTRSGRGEGYSNRGGLRLPPSFHFRHSSGRISPRAGPEFTSNDQLSSSSLSNCWFTPPPAYVESKRVTYLRPERPYRQSGGEFWPSMQHEWRSRGGSYNDGISGASTSGRFPDALALRHYKVPGHRAGQTPNFLNETVDSFSYWNMGRKKRTSTVSSVSPVTALGGDLGRKRNSDADALIYSKLRKMGSED